MSLPYHLPVLATSDGMMSDYSYSFTKLGRLGCLSDIVSELCFKGCSLDMLNFLRVSTIVTVGHVHQ